MGGLMMNFSDSFAAQMPQVGDKAPDFSVMASDGTTVHLKEYVGKDMIVLYFYPKDDTPEIGRAHV
jgi:peroxiredoxin